MLVPVLVAIPYVSRAWLNALPGLRGAGQCRRRRARGGTARRRPQRPLRGSTRSSIAASLPAVVLVVTYLVRDAYRRLAERTEQLEESRTRIVEVADAARRSLERDLHDGAQQRLLAMSVTIERARKELQAGRQRGRRGAARPAGRRQPRDPRRAARAGAGHLPAAARRARPGGRPAGDGPPLGRAGDARRGARLRAPEPPGRGGGLLLHPRGADQRGQARRGDEACG